MEYFDVLDEKGNQIGVTKPRTQVHKDGDWHRAVHIWLINSKDELLIQKRSQTKDSYPNMWDISIAGHLLAGQDEISAAIREIQEELGLSFTKKYFQHLFTYKSQKVLNGGTFINNEIDNVYLVHSDVNLSDLKLQEDEVSEIKLIPYKNLEKIIEKKDKTFVPHDEEYKRLFALLNDA